MLVLPLLIWISVFLLHCTTPCLAFNIVKTSFQEEVSIGDTIKLSCTSDGYFEHCVWRHKSEVCEYEWKKSHDAVLKQRCSARIDSRIKFMGEYNKHECSIEIEDANLEDAGGWQCEMEAYMWGPIAGATDKKKLMLKVKEKDQVIIKDPTEPTKTDLVTKEPENETKDKIYNSTESVTPSTLSITPTLDIVNTTALQDDFISTKDTSQTFNESAATPKYSDFHPRIGIHEPIDAEESSVSDYDFGAISNEDNDSIPFIGAIIGGSLILVLCICIAGYLILRQRRRQLLISDWKDHQSKSNPKSPNSTCKVEMNTILDDVDDLSGPYDEDPEVNHPSPLTSRNNP